jgi:hypothetical protein
MQGNTTLPRSRRSTEKENRRKVMDLELKDPISFKTISPQEKEEPKEGKGEILSFNENGLLLLTDNALEEGSFINISIDFKEIGLLDGILGKVKKTEKSDEQDFYVGVELYSPEQIKAEALSGLFPVKMESFETKLKQSLADYFNRVKSAREKKNFD